MEEEQLETNTKKIQREDKHICKKEDPFVTELKTDKLFSAMVTYNRKKRATENHKKQLQRKDFF